MLWPEGDAAVRRKIYEEHVAGGRCASADAGEHADVRRVEVNRLQRRLHADGVWIRAAFVALAATSDGRRPRRM